MNNELAIAMLVEHDLCEANGSNYKDIINDIVYDKLMVASNKDFLWGKMIELYHGFLEENNKIPTVDDMEDEVNFYNISQFEAIAKLKLAYDPVVIQLLSTEEGRDNWLGVSEYSSESEMMDEAINMMVNDYLEEISYNCNDISRDDISLILNESGVAFYLSFDDPFYDTFSYLGDFGTFMLCNDAQQTMFSEFGWEFYQAAYCTDERIAERMPPRNFILIRRDQSVSDSTNLLAAGGYAS